jgi:hypothetical protein
MVGSQLIPWENARNEKRMKRVDRNIFFIENRLVIGINKDKLFAKNVPCCDKLRFQGLVYTETVKYNESFQN